MPPAPTPTRLLQLLAHHEHAAEAIRTVLRLLGTADQERASTNGASVQAKALALESDRVDSRTASGSRGSRENQLAVRAGTAALLERMDRKTPTAPYVLGHHAGALVASGHIQHRGDGYVRTAKPFDPKRIVSSRGRKAAVAATVEPRRRGRPPGPKRAQRRSPEERRASTLALLQALATPTEFPEGKTPPGIGILKHHGYVKHTAKGWVATGKELPA